MSDLRIQLTDADLHALANVGAITEVRHDGGYTITVDQDARRALKILTGPLELNRAAFLGAFSSYAEAAGESLDPEDLETIGALFDLWWQTLHATRDHQEDPGRAALWAELTGALEGCPRCEYDEAEGGLWRHCADCQLRVTRAAWAIVKGE